MISQALFFAFFAHPRFVLRGAIASLSLILIAASHPSPTYSQEQTRGSETSASPTATPSVSGNASGGRSILKQGSRGESVSDLQALLRLLGFYGGAIDGVYQDSTASAVAAFQQAAGLQADGVVGSETWTRLLPPSPVVSGSTANAPGTGSTNAVSPLNGGAIANSSATPPSSSFPTPTTAPSSTFPSPTAQSPSTSVTPPASTPATPPASQTPTPQSSPQTPTSQPSTPQTPTSVSVDLPILRVGMRGSAVNGLQERLKAIGAFKGAIDGVFGSETQEAVKSAQRSFNLEPDGIVGPETWTALLR